jgi:hypothetical protein
MRVTIAAIAGSLRVGSHTRALLRATAYDLPPGIRLAIWDGLGHVPPFSEDAETGPAPTGVAALRRLIAGAGAVLIVTPEYNGSIPGPLKNALDWGFPATGRRRAGRQAGRRDQRQPQPPRRRLGLADLRKVLTVTGADLTGTELAVPQVHAQLTPGGRIADPALRARITALITDLAQHATAAGPALAA